MSLGQIFNQIYKTNTWGIGSITKPHSGSGSVPENAQPYVDFVGKVIQTYKLEKVLDVGHGDFEMWRDWQFPGIDYLGVDVSDEATRIARSKYPNFNFITLDLAQTKAIPSADILISKDCLQHLPNHAILMLLQKFSSYEFLVICNDILVPFESWLAKLKFYGQIRTRIRAFLSLRSPFFLVHRKNNVDIEAGDFRCLDLKLEPFSGAFFGYDLMETFDFDGPKRDGIKKRVYFFIKKVTS